MVNGSTPVFSSMEEKIQSIIRERYGGIIPRGALTQIAMEVGVSRQYVWRCAVEFAQADRKKDDRRRRCIFDGCDGYAKGRSKWCSEHISIKLVCAECGAMFLRRRNDQAQREKSPSYTGINYCGKVCFGKYIGRTYGFKKVKESAG